MEQNKKTYVADFKFDEETLTSMVRALNSALRVERRRELDHARRREYVRASECQTRQREYAQTLDIVQDALDDIALQKEVEIDGVENKV